MVSVSMKMINLLRALLFNICYYGFTAICCFVYLPALLLPYHLYWKVLKTYFVGVYWIEKYVLGLDYEVRGLENLPKDGSFLVAAKHQSAYETLKLPILFNEPGVVLKKELVMIPLWGWFALKAGMIAIDRSNRDSSLRSITEGAIKLRDQGRPIVIFPQGTRVAVGDSKSYKGGIIKMQEAAELNIIPMALNSGLFWGRNSFLKRPGKVIFEFLPAMPPHKDPKNAIKVLEATLEEYSNKLVAEAREKYPYLD